MKLDFRVYHEGFNTMVYSNFDDFRLASKRIFRETFEKGTLWCNPVTHSYLRYSISLDHPDFMLNSGLKDKTDLPIYEKDILKIEDSKDEYISIDEYTVIFDSGAFYAECKGSKVEGYPKKILLNTINTISTVIGNTYKKIK